MPAYNEEGCIEKVVKTWHGILSQLVGSDFSMIVVNDGSKDKTGEILDRLSKEVTGLKPIHQKNAGHGAALMKGYQAAVLERPEFIFQVDSDDQFMAEDLQLLWKERESSNFILGYRQVRHDALHRLVITRILRALILVVFGAFVRDSNIPFRLIRARYLEALLKELPPQVFAPNVFLSVLAARAGENLWSIPVRHQDRMTGTVSIVRWKLIKVCIRTARELVKFRLGLSSAIRRIHATMSSGQLKNSLGSSQ